MASPCNYCSIVKEPENTMVFWDDKSYCRDCIDSVCPELWDFRIANKVLVEKAPFHKDVIWNNAFKTEAIVFGIFALIFGIGFYSQYGVSGVVLAIGFTMMICLVQGSLQLPMFVWHTKNQLPTTQVSKGQIECYRGNGRWPSIRTHANLENVKWRIGKSKQDTGLGQTMIGKQQVVLIMFPKRIGRFWLGYEKFACGWSPKMHRIWVGFLTLTGSDELGNKRVLKKMLGTLS